MADKLLGFTVPQLLVIGVVAFLIASYSGGSSLQALLGGQTVSQGEAVTVSTYGNCGDDNLATLYAIGTSTVPTVTGATTNPVIAAAGVTSGAMLFKNGANNLIAPAQTASLAATFTAFGTQVGCDGTYYVIGGNDTAAAAKATQGYYLTETDPVSISGDTYFELNIVPQGNVTLFARGPTTLYNATQLSLGTFAASTTYPGYYVRLSETRRGDFLYPHLAFGTTAASTAALANQFTTFQPALSTRATVPNRLAGTYNSAYKLDADKISYNSELEIPLEITTTAAYVANTCNVTMIAYDLGTYVDRGHIVVAAENLADTNVGGEDSSVFTFDTH